MIRLSRTSDKIKYKIGEIEISISPLSFQDKDELREHMIAAKDGDMKAAMAGAVKAIKFALKDISGVEDFDGNPYKLQFEDDSNRRLTDECVSDLMNLEENPKLIAACSMLIARLPKDGDIEGVSLVKKEAPPVKNDEEVPSK
jgi:hypothetical protein